MHMKKQVFIYQLMQGTSSLVNLALREYPYSKMFTITKLLVWLLEACVGKVKSHIWLLGQV